MTYEEIIKALRVCGRESATDAWHLNKHAAHCAPRPPLPLRI